MKKDDSLLKQHSFDEGIYPFVKTKVLRISLIAISPFLVLFTYSLLIPVIALRPKFPTEKFLRKQISRFKYAFLGFKKAKYSRHQQFWNNPDLFEHTSDAASLGLPSGQLLHDFIVIDNFYNDPDEVRDFALRQNYIQYGRTWYSTALEIRENVLKGKGIRLATPEIKGRLCDIIKSDIDDESWETSGDGWNGAFHLKFEDYLPWSYSSIHNHAGRPEDVITGWSGLVFLDPNAPKNHGTTIWREKETGKCFSNTSVYSYNLDQFELIYSAENIYNRLILFYANVFHMGAEGYGHMPRSARLFQTFFFNAQTK